MTASIMITNTNTMAMCIVQNKKAHKDWQLRATVGLMLLSMVVYLLTMDDSWQLFR